MDITDLLSQTGGLDSIARDLGISPQQAATGASALAPSTPGGGLGGLLDANDDGNPLDDVLRMAGKLGR